MNYQEAVDYLFSSAPLFQNIGQGAYKEGLSNTLALDAHFGHPHQQYRTIHVAGTNGKGSCAHTLASILQAQGYKVGLYTSPHLVDFKERIRVNGNPVDEGFITRFVETERNFFEPLHPSFFELATAMAFLYFARQKVEVAVIEVGLGGRLDCTNIIHPDLSIITNISFDHMAFLGDTLAKIAGEKAGIIKKEIPALIGESLPETRPIFEQKAREAGAPLYFAEDHPLVLSHQPNADNTSLYQTEDYPQLKVELNGFCQVHNTNTLLAAIRLLNQQGYHLTENAVRKGFATVCESTHLMGRWQKLQEHPTLICDTGHNIGGFQYIVPQIESQQCRQLRIIFGMVSDKDIHAVLGILPQKAIYYFTKASVHRALNEEVLAQMARAQGLQGTSYPTVAKAVSAALSQADQSDFIYVGGSSFVVADLLTHWPNL